MSRSLSLLLSAVTALPAAGCLDLGRARLRLSEVEVTTESSGRVSRTTTEISYKKSNEVDEIETRTEGAFTSRAELGHKDGQLVEATLLYDGRDPIEVELEWEGKLLAKAQTAYDGATVRQEYSFFHGDPKLIDAVESTTETESGVITVVRTKHAYDEQARVKGTEALTTTSIRDSDAEPSSSSVDADLRWSDEGHLDRVTRTTKYGDASSSTVVGYDYDEQGRLAEVEEDGARTTFDYDDEGRLVEIERVAGGVRTTWDLSYAEGQVSGFVFTPEVAGAFFDLKGRVFPQLDVMSSGFAPFLQVGGAGGPGALPINDGEDDGTDTWEDHCLENGWYGDGSCDDCPQPDPDC